MCHPLAEAKRPNLGLVVGDASPDRIAETSVSILAHIWSSWANCGRRPRLYPSRSARRGTVLGHPVSSPDVGRDLTRVALSALADPAAATTVTDAHLLLAPSGARGAPSSIWSTWSSPCPGRAGWMAGVLEPDPTVRSAALDLHAPRGRRNVEAVEKLLLRDPSPRVRGACQRV
jgi:hypothetical protein